MLLSVTIDKKTAGAKELFHDLRLVLAPKEKVAIIGRNGVGKTTLFNIISGADEDYEGNIERRAGLRTVTTRQEFDLHENQSVVEYIRDNLPEYLQLKRVIDTYPETMGNDHSRIGKYSDSVDRFGRLGYYDVEETIVRRLADYQIDSVQAYDDFAKLSGGEKRFAELVRVELSVADLALFDEPTNHMDFVGKAAFITWLKEAQEAVAVITHDRDVLAAVDRILEIKDGGVQSFKGNYDSYLAQNSQATAQQMEQYELSLRTIENLKKQIAYARSKKAGWGGTADKKNPFVVMEERAQRELKKILAEQTKPSFWIDRESIENMREEVIEKYDRYKAKNIRIRPKGEGRFRRELLVVENLSLGYTKPLFAEINFTLSSDDRLQIKGRNGVGKSTLVKALIDSINHEPLESKCFGGKIQPDQHVRLGIYEQEIDPGLLDLDLGEAVMQMYRQRGLAVNEQNMKQLLAEYLFDPSIDARLQVSRLSGGQKARLQIMSMLSGEPNLLILDEPTNHLDLPSIEELENALQKYTGAIIYVSHDSYFARNVGGDIIEITG
jgi:ATP-binding cassette, subfamily F, member 3